MKCRLIPGVAISTAIFVLTAAAASAGERPDSPGPSATASAVQVDLPSNLEFAANLRPLLERMWRQSPTFRRQCARLAFARELTIVLHPGVMPDRAKSVANAVTELDMQQGQLVRAEVWLSPRDLEQHIAHEIEHIIERLDGVRVELMAALSVEGVHRVGDWFETERAREIGLTVAREVRDR